VKKVTMTKTDVLPTERTTGAGAQNYTGWSLERPFPTDVTGGVERELGRRQMLPVS
jgi:hypothetical protein